MTETIDDIIEILEEALYDPVRYMGQYWWQFFDGRQVKPGKQYWARSDNWQWPQFWGHRYSLGEDKV